MESKIKEIIKNIEICSEYLNTLQSEINNLSKIDTKNFIHYKLNVWFDDNMPSNRGFNLLGFGIHFDKDNVESLNSNLFNFIDDEQLKYFKEEALKRDEAMIHVILKLIYNETKQFLNY